MIRIESPSQPIVIALALALAAASSGCRNPTSERTAPFSIEALAETPVVDGHNDFVIHFISGDSVLPVGAYDMYAGSGQTDIRRWHAGGVGASFVTVSGEQTPDVESGIRQTLDLIRRLADQYPQDLAMAGTVAEIRHAHASGRISLLPHLEDGGQIGGSVERLRALHELGLRSMGLTWNRTTDLADAALDSARWGGLSPLGESVVAAMNRLGVLIDLSHSSDDAAMDAMAQSKAPVIFSHSSARAIANVRRNVPDHVLERVAANGGVVMVTFVPYFTTDAYASWYARGEAVWDSLRAAHRGNDTVAGRAMEAWEGTNPPPSVTLNDVADHVEHVRTEAGIDHVGLGSDFDGMYSHVDGLDDVAAFPALLEELAGRGWNDDELRKLMGENVLRVLAAVDSVADSLRRR